MSLFTRLMLKWKFKTEGRIKMLAFVDIAPSVEGIKTQKILNCNENVSYLLLWNTVNINIHFFILKLIKRKLRKSISEERNKTSI